VDGDVDLVAVAGQRLVDRVVHHLVDEMVQAGRAGGADVHGGPLTDRLEALEDLDLVGSVIVGRAVPVAVRPGARRDRSGVRLELRVPIVWLVLVSRVFHACPW
jgi:hypothetical protein